MRRSIAIVAGGIVVGGAGLGVFAASTLFQVSDNLSTNAISRPGPEPVVSEIPDWDGPVNLLIMGSDSRDNLTSGDYGSEDTAGARSDTMLLVHVTANHRAATVVSIPRDTMLPRPECTDSDGQLVDASDVEQVNAALDYGPYCSLDTIRDFTGLDLDHFVTVNFDGAIAVSDAVGGVDVCVAQDIDDDYSGLHLAQGEHTISGVEALAFMRTRHGFGDGSDLGRIGAQQVFLSSLLRKVKSAGTLTNPLALFNLADAASKSITVDEPLADVGTLMGLGGTLATVDPSQVVFVQLPVQDYWADSNRVQPIEDEADALFEALRTDTPILFSSDESSAEDAGQQVDESSPQLTLAPDVRGQRADQSPCAG